MTTILLTGFEAFAGDAINPSGEAVRLVADRWGGPELLVTDVLPVTFDGALIRLRDLLRECEPDLVIATGLAGDRAALTPERVAINLADARIPDNAGRQPRDEPVVPEGPAAYFSTLPVKAMSAAIARAGLPSAVSYSAGTFVCNAVMYAALHATAASATRAGFVHVPRTGAGGMELPAIVRGLEIAVRAAADTPHDVRAPGGTLS